jgi:acetyl-CoA carboxylase alpha subunit
MDILRNNICSSIKGWIDMGFHSVFGKKKKIGKSIRTFVKKRVNEKRGFEEQLERLEAQLENKTLDQFTYERMRDILKINFVQQREEARTYIQNTFRNTHSL